MDEASSEPISTDARPLFNPLERIAIKHMPSKNGIEKVLLFVGAKNSFRSQATVASQAQRAIDKGFLACAGTTDGCRWCTRLKDKYGPRIYL